MKYFKRGILTILFCTIWILIPTLCLPHHIEYVPPLLKEPIPIEKLVLENMTLEEKVGQLFMLGFNGTTLSKSTKDWIQNRYIGGVLLLSRNIANETQLKKLTKNIQSNSNIPLFISIDQEGGVVSRLQWNTTLTTPQMSMNTPQQAYDIAVARGKILKDLGINMNLAPVVEYITDSSSFMYKRVFRGTQRDVARKGESAINGYTSVNIIPVPKHYPGHSNSSPDSHYYLPKVNITPSQWDSYIYPFKYLIERDCVDILMAGHILFPNIDTKVSTLSTEILTEKLRKELSFEGVILSDDMEMDAIKERGDINTIAKESLLAGIDILIYSKESVEQNQVYEYILQSFEKGDIDMKILDEKVLRILKLKSKYGMLQSITLQLSLE